MAILELTIPDALLEEWIIYADSAGLSIESMIQEATTHSVRNDRLGVEDARLQRLLRETRELELLARQGKATNTSSGSNDSKNRSEQGIEKSSPRKEHKQPAPIISAANTDDALDDARVPQDFFDETSNMANLDLHIPRDV